MNNKENIDAIAQKISIIKSFVDDWKITGDVSAIERKVVKDNVSAIYEILHQIKPDSQKIETKSEIIPQQNKTSVENELPEINIFAEPEIQPEIETPKVPKPTETEQVKPEIKAPANTTQNVETLGESLQKNKRVLYDDFAERDEPYLTPIQDLSKGIGLNDKFLFSKELFGGNAQNFERAVLTINSMPSLNDAMAYINQNFNWPAENAVVKHFISLVKRRFM